MSYNVDQRDLTFHPTLALDGYFPRGFVGGEMRQSHSPQDVYDSLETPSIVRTTTSKIIIVSCASSIGTGIIILRKVFVRHDSTQPRR